MLTKHSSTFYLAETFMSIEGEGRFQGQPTFFIRLQGCSLRCDYCDTKYTWNCDHKNMKHISTILDLIKPYAAIYKKFRISITGGNPVEHKNLKYLITELRKLDCVSRIHLEHPGIIFNKNFERSIFNLVDDVCFDIKPLSSKIEEDLIFKSLDWMFETKHNGMFNVLANIPLRSEFKCVFSDKEDLDFFAKVFTLHKELSAFDCTFSPAFLAEKKKFAIENNPELFDMFLHYQCNGIFPFSSRLGIQINKCLNLN